MYSAGQTAPPHAHVAAMCSRARCCGSGVPVRIPPVGPPTACRRPGKRWCGWPTPAGVSRAVSRPPRAQWAWTHMKCAVPGAGTHLRLPAAVQDLCRKVADRALPLGRKSPDQVPYTYQSHYAADGGRPPGGLEDANGQAFRREVDRTTITRLPGTPTQVAARQPERKNTPCAWSTPAGMFQRFQARTDGDEDEDLPSPEIPQDVTGLSRDPPAER